MGFDGDYSTLVATNAGVADFEASLLTSLSNRTTETVTINAETTQVMTRAGSIVVTFSFLETSGMTATEAQRLAASVTSSPLLATANRQQFTTWSATVAAGTLSPAMSPSVSPTSNPTSQGTEAPGALGSASSDSGGDAGFVIGGVVGAILIVVVMVGVVMLRKRRAADANAAAYYDAKADAKADAIADAKSPESTIELQGQTHRIEGVVSEAYDHGNEEAMHGHVEDSDGLPLRGQTIIGRGTRIQLDASTGGVHAKSVRRQDSLRQEVSTDAAPPSDSVVAVTETGLPGMPTRGMAGQPMEPDNVDAADNDGYIDTELDPSADNMPYNISPLRQHSDV